MSLRWMLWHQKIPWFQPLEFRNSVDFKISSLLDPPVITKENSGKNSFDFLWNFYEIFMKFVWNLYEIFMKFLWNFYEICMKFVWNLYEICMKFVRNLYEICTKLVWNLYEICMKFAWNLCEICMKLYEILHWSKNYDDYGICFNKKFQRHLL